MIVTCPRCGAKNRVDERAEARRPICGKCSTPLPVTDAASPMTVTDASFANDVLNSPVPVVVDCWAPWCGPCRMMMPTIDRLARESEGKYRVAKLNTDENPQIASQYHIDGIPTLLILQQGRLLQKLVGVQPFETVKSHLDRLS